MRYTGIKYITYEERKGKVGSCINFGIKMSQFWYGFVILLTRKKNLVDMAKQVCCEQLINISTYRARDWENGNGLVHRCPRDLRLSASGDAIERHL